MRDPIYWIVFSRAILLRSGKPEPASIGFGSISKRRPALFQHLGQQQSSLLNATRNFIT
jgi:hypothetical protein